MGGFAPRILKATPAPPALDTSQVTFRIHVYTNPPTDLPAAFLTPMLEGGRGGVVDGAAGGSAERGSGQDGDSGRKGKSGESEGGSKGKDEKDGEEGVKEEADNEQKKGETN